MSRKVGPPTRENLLINSENIRRFALLRESLALPQKSYASNNREFQDAPLYPRTTFQVTD